MDFWNILLFVTCGLLTSTLLGIVLFELLKLKDRKRKW